MLNSTLSRQQRKRVAPKLKWNKSTRSSCVIEGELCINVQYCFWLRTIYEIQSLSLVNIYFGWNEGDLMLAILNFRFFAIR